MYKIIDIKNKKKFNLIWIDKCEYKLFNIINNYNYNYNYSFLLLPPIPWNLLKNIRYNNYDFIIINDFWALEYFKWKKNIIIWRILITNITRDFKNLIYFLEKIKNYSISWIFINYSDYFFLNYEILNYIKKNKKKIWVFIKEDLVAYTPRCHYMIYKKDKWNFSERDCNLYCETIKKEKIFIVWANKNAILDYKFFLFKNDNFDRIKEDKIKFNFIDYLIY